MHVFQLGEAERNYEFGLGNKHTQASGCRSALEWFNTLDSCSQLAMECVRRALENIEQMQKDCDNEQVYRHAPSHYWKSCWASTV